MVQREDEGVLWGSVIGPGASAETAKLRAGLPTTARQKSTKWHPSPHEPASTDSRVAQPMVGRSPTGVDSVVNMDRVGTTGQRSKRGRVAGAYRRLKSTTSGAFATSSGRSASRLSSSIARGFSRKTDLPASSAACASLARESCRVLTSTTSIDGSEMTAAGRSYPGTAELSRSTERARSAPTSDSNEVYLSVADKRQQGGACEKPRADQAQPQPARRRPAVGTPGSIPHPPASRSDARWAKPGNAKESPSALISQAPHRPPWHERCRIRV